jgi:hypothetical protein
MSESEAKMEKRRKRMCDTCIYRTGELTRNRLQHTCHEHAVGNIIDNSVACAGSCKSYGMALINTPTPNRKNWSGSVGFYAMSDAIERLLERGRGKRKMSDPVRLYKVSKGGINLIM